MQFGLKQYNGRWGQDWTNKRFAEVLNETKLLLNCECTRIHRDGIGTKGNFYYARKMSMKLIMQSLSAHFIRSFAYLKSLRKK